MLDMKGPGGKLNYFGHGSFTVSKNPSLGKINRKQLGFIAGGTGIAPCWHVLQATARHQDGCSVKLLYANHTPADILIKANIDDLISKHPTNLKVDYMVTKPDAEWNGLTGHITRETLAKSMPPPSSDTLIMFSGTKPFNSFMFNTLEDMGYTDAMIVKF
jgi:NAD(P)H-flavin reductase